MWEDIVEYGEMKLGMERTTGELLLMSKNVWCEVHICLGARKDEFNKPGRGSTEVDI